MAERSEIEINLKSTADTSGAQQMAAALQQVQQQQEQANRGVVSPAFAALQASRNRPLLNETGAPFGEGVDDQLYRLRGTQQQQFSRLTTQRYTQSQQQAENLARRTGAAFSSLTTGNQIGNLPGENANQGGGGGGGAGGGLFDRNTQSVIRFTAALAGLGVGLSVYYFAGRLLHQAIAAIVDDEKNAIQATINLNAAFGNSAQAYSNLARSISTGGQGSGFIFKASDIQQTISGFKGLQDQFNLSETDLVNLTEASTKLAAIHDIPLSDASTALSQALSGSSTAADKLGLSLSDLTVQQQYANGQFAGAFQLLTPYEQAAARLAVAQQQVAEQSKNVGTALNPLSEATRQLAANWENLNKTLGSPVLQTAASAVEGVAAALKEVNGLIVGFQTLPSGIQELGKQMAIIAALGPAIGAPLTAIATLAQALNNTTLGDRLKQIWTEAQKAASDYAKQVSSTTDLPQTGLGQQLATKAGEAWDALTQKAQDAKDQLSQALSSSQSSTQQDQLNQELKTAADSYDEVTKAAKTAKQAEDAFWTALSNSAPAIQGQANAFTGAVSNINNLTDAQRNSLAIRQAELGALKEHQLAVTQAQQAEYGESSAVKGLVDAYKNLIDAQSEVNRLQQEGIQLQGDLAQAQLNALTANRAAQDLELRIQRDQLQGTDRLISAQERAAARRDVRQARILQPDVQLRAFDANLPTIQVQRQEEVNQLLTRIAQATEAQAQQTIDLRITVNGAQVSATGGA